MSHKPSANDRDIRESFYINESESNDLAKVAYELGLSRSALVRMVFLEWLRAQSIVNGRQLIAGR